MQTNIILWNSMTDKLPLTLAAPAQHLRHLVMIRWLLIICLCATAVLTFIFSDLTLPYQAFATILLTFIPINWLTALRLRREVPVTDIEFFVQLLLDVLCLSALFYFSGGANSRKSIAERVRFTLGATAGGRIEDDG